MIKFKDLVDATPKFNIQTATVQARKRTLKASWTIEEPQECECFISDEAVEELMKLMISQEQK